LVEVEEFAQLLNASSPLTAGDTILLDGYFPANTGCYLYRSLLRLSEIDTDERGSLSLA
jgi:hypothetical protein